MNRRLGVALVVAMAAACSSGQNSECRWPDDPPRLLNLALGADAQHLSRDIELVEELAVRFADASTLGPGPLKQQYRVERCYDPLMSGLVARHGVTMSDVRSAQSRLGDRGLNLVVNLPVALLFIVISIFALRTIRRRFSPDEPLAIAGATLFAGVAVPAFTVGVGRIWQMLSETIRVGNGHLGGQRGLRLPWVQHFAEYGVIAVAAFAVLAVVYFVTARGSWGGSESAPPAASGGLHGGR